MIEASEINGTNEGREWGKFFVGIYTLYGKNTNFGDDLTSFFDGLDSIRTKNLDECPKGYKKIYDILIGGDLYLKHFQDLLQYLVLSYVSSGNFKDEGGKKEEVILLLGEFITEMRRLRENESPFENLSEKVLAKVEKVLNNNSYTHLGNSDILIEKIKNILEKKG